MLHSTLLQRPHLLPCMFNISFLCRYFCQLVMLLESCKIDAAYVATTQDSGHSFVAGFLKQASLVDNFCALSNAASFLLTFVGLEPLRVLSCAGANTVRNPTNITDIALRPGRRQSSLDREARNAEQHWWWPNVSLTVSGKNWQLG